MIVSPGAIVGSVGVVASISKDDGRTIEVVSTQSPNKRPDVQTESGRAEIQRVIDALAQVLIDSVALHRGLTPRR